MLPAFLTLRESIPGSRFQFFARCRRKIHTSEHRVTSGPTAQRLSRELFFLGTEEGENVLCVS